MSEDVAWIINTREEWEEEINALAVNLNGTQKTNFMFTTLGVYLLLLPTLYLTLVGV